MSKYYMDKDSPSALLERTQTIHNEMVSIYSEQVRQLQIRIAILEDENKKLKERLENYET